MKARKNEEKRRKNEKEKAERLAVERTVRRYRLGEKVTKTRAFGKGGKQGISAAVSLPCPVLCEGTEGDGTFDLSEAGAGRIAEFYRELGEKTLAAFREEAKTEEKSLSLTETFSVGRKKRRLTVTRSLSVAEFSRASLTGEPTAIRKTCETDVFLLPEGFLLK